MVVYSCRLSQKKRGTKRRRSGVPVVVPRRPRRTRPARVFRREAVSVLGSCLLRVLVRFLMRRAGTTRQT